MRILTTTELAREPQRLLHEAGVESVTLVSDDGAPLMLTVPLGRAGSIENALVDLAAQLYDRELISLERAARIAGMSYSGTIDEFGRRGIATIRTTPEELERELASFGS